ncbi:hypothetical protein A6P39_003690 [Streptomyces sp. FXJ1.172]|uniref:hypothetical protein n=1 Tax=Streptomyces sp. FXJ1.172 TaxID=710705 RepID=UPI0007D0266D|nr:hypothetical protein [Streptomyces sp. FXJ1.172]WEO93220.1 hypothetical protein A6P39_003690 [Streptomyces sp. FXJ1.172]
MTHTDRIADLWGPHTPHSGGTPWPRQVDQFLADATTEAEVQAWVRDACLLCSNGCGLEVAVRDGRMVGVRGRAEVSVERVGPGHGPAPAPTTTASSPVRPLGSTGHE